MRYTSWSVIIDDIVFPDGRTAMGVLGGGGTYAVAGMRPWSADVGVMGKVGTDFDQTILQQIGSDGSGLLVNERPTPRAWQLFEEDGHRTQIPRIPLDDWAEQLSWLDDAAASLRTHHVQAVHMLSRGLPGNLETVAQIAASGIRISLEPIIEEGMDPAQRDQVLATLPYVEIFSPGMQELRVLMGDTPPARALPELAERGPAIVALRQGSTGSLIYHRESGRMLKVPAARARVIDVTGAGNAYAGGMLVGWCEYGTLEMAAACAAVSAALVLEQVGPPVFTNTLLAEAEQRRTELLKQLHDVQGNNHD